MTDYPNREHENKDKAARRRAHAALDMIASEVSVVGRRIEGGGADADDCRQMAEHVRALTEHLAVLETLREVREWHAADHPEIAAGRIRLASPPYPTHRYAGRDSKRQSVGKPGHCERCAEFGHVRAHPSLGCGDVGCSDAHGPADEAILAVIARRTT